MTSTSASSTRRTATTTITRRACRSASWAPRARSDWSGSHIAGNSTEQTRLVYIDHMDKPKQKAERLRALRSAAGAWKGRTKTGAEYVEQLRSGRLGRLLRRKERSR